MERLTLFCRWSKASEARLKSHPSRSWRFPNRQRDGAVESHSSQSARRMGHPRFVVASASAKQQVPHRAFSPVRNDKVSK
jgi:hypothetical protein